LTIKIEFSTFFFLKVRRDSRRLLLFFMRTEKEMQRKRQETVGQPIRRLGRLRMKWGAWFIVEAAHSASRSRRANLVCPDPGFERARASQTASWLRVFRAKVKDARTRFRSSPRPSRARVYGNHSRSCDLPRSVILLDEKEDPAIVNPRNFPKLKVDFSPFQSLDSFPVRL